MTSVSVRFEEMTASHRFELQSETKDNHQQSRKSRTCLSRSLCRKPKRVLFQVTKPEKASKKKASKKKLNNRGNIIQLQTETAYLPPSCSLLRETMVKISLEN